MEFPQKKLQDLRGLEFGSRLEIEYMEGRIGVGIICFCFGVKDMYVLTRKSRDERVREMQKFNFILSPRICVFTSLV